MRWLAVLVLAAGCHSSPGDGVYSPASGQQGSTVVAERLTKEAADLVHSDPKRAETLLRRALDEDLFFGPAHNNLGVIHLERGELYEAANEFEWARKLMPGHPDPRLNLAITLDQRPHF